VKPSSTQYPQIYLCVGLNTAGTVLLELSLARLFAVIFDPHTAFAAICIALAGLSVGGMFSYAVVSRQSPLFRRLGRLSAANSLLVLLALGAAVTLGSPLLIVVAALLPFVVSGTILALAFAETAGVAGRVFLADLLGAAGGWLLLLLLLNQFGGPSTVVGAAILFAAAGAIWQSMGDSVAGRAGSVALALALVALLTYVHRFPIEVRNAKGLPVAESPYVKWNHVSRVAIVPDGRTKRDTISIDGAGSTVIANFDFDRLTPGDRGELVSGGPALPYSLRPGAKTLIVGPGGGMDLARALASGSRDITAAEINPAIVAIMREKFPNLSRGLYLLPEIQIFTEDGRSFVRRSAAKYQVLQATMVDAEVSTAVPFALPVSRLYTIDAFRDYLAHLTDDGLIAITLRGFDPPRESLRLVSLAIESLVRLGESQPWRHIIAGRERQPDGLYDTVLVSRQPFTPDDLNRARGQFLATGMEALYLPDSDSHNPFSELQHSTNPEEYERNYAFDITPVTDNRPSFFYTAQPRDAWSFASPGASNRAVPLVLILAGGSLVLTAALLVVPLAGPSLPFRLAGWETCPTHGFLLYFAFIGAGYVLVEAALFQKLALFLGHPSYVVTAVVAPLLVSSGLGSAASRRVVGQSEGRLIKSLGSAGLLAALLALVLSGLTSGLVWLPAGWKVVITVALIAPLGFVMGIPFPAALEQLREWCAPAVRWAWSVHAAAAVLGSVGAAVCTIYLGLVQTLIIGGLLYLAALSVVARGRPRMATEPEPGASRVVLAE
jgi:hypothetical protein